MHEVGIASSILEAARAEVERRPGSRLISVGVRVGVLSGVDVAALQFAFECIVAGTSEAEVVLVPQECARMNQCGRCALQFPSPAGAPFVEARCPRCGEHNTSFVSGDQLEIAFVEVDEP